MTVNLKVTQEKFDEFFSIDDWFSFSSMTNKEMYEKMILFVVDDKGEPVTPAQARAMFKTVKKSEWGQYVADFIKLVGEAFVSPTSGGS